MQTGDYKFVKNLNERLVLNLIRRYEVISSSDLVRITGMRPSTIFNILKDFTEKNFVNNLGKGQSTDKGGKKPYLWSLKSTAAYSIGVDVDRNKITFVILNFINEIIYELDFEVDVFAESNNLLEILKEKINSFIINSQLPKEKFLGIGIAFPGIVDPENGKVILSEIISGSDIDFTTPLKEYFNLPVLLQNNANTTAVGEKIAGNARQSKHLISALIKSNEVSNGIGVGVLINEEIHFGASNCAGEINFALPYFAEIFNSIRNSLSESELLKSYLTETDKLTIKILIDAAKQNDKVAIQFFKKLGYFIGKGLVKPIELINPDTLVLGGDLVEVGNIIREEIYNVLDFEIHNLNRKIIDIKISKFGDKAVAIGAAAIILSEYFKVPNLENNKLEEN